MVSISEVYTGPDKQIEVNEIFRFQRIGMGKTGEVMGYFTPTGKIPRCLERLTTYGIEIDESLFQSTEVKRREHLHPV
jgi:pilus assembly protein CpaF